MTSFNTISLLTYHTETRLANPGLKNPKPGKKHQQTFWLLSNQYHLRHHAPIRTYHSPLHRFTKDLEIMSLFRVAVARGPTTSASTIFRTNNSPVTRVLAARSNAVLPATASSFSTSVPRRSAHEEETFEEFTSRWVTCTRARGAFAGRAEHWTTAEDAHGRRGYRQLRMK